MKTVTERPSFQGDLCIRRIDHIPTAAVKVDREWTNQQDGRGNWILAHSETGHHHVVADRAAQMLIDQTNQFIAYLAVAEPTELQHLRSFDTHETLLLPPGNYEIRRQREHVPEGWRRAAD